MNADFFFPFANLDAIHMIRTGVSTPVTSISGSPRAQREFLSDSSVSPSSTIHSPIMNQPLAATVSGPKPLYKEPENMTECAGHRFDAYAMAEDMFFYDLVCGFTSLVLDRYRTVTGMIIMKHESGLYSVTPLDNAGRAPPEGTLDRRDLSIQAGTLHVARCPDPARCLQQKNKHHCIDVQSVARQFMFWFIEWRARIQRPMPPPIECDIENVFRLHSERCAEDDERDWDWRRYAVYNLIREIRDPISSRRGYIKPEDGEPIRRPWKIGDKYIHGVLKWRSIDDAFILREIHCAMLGAMRERLLRRRDPELMTDLWDMAWRDRPDLATLPQPFQSPPRCTNPKRDRNKENVADAEARPGKISRLRR